MRPTYNWGLFRAEFLGGVNKTEWTLNNRCVYHHCLLYCRKYGVESNGHTALFSELPSYCLDHVSAFSLVTPGITQCSGNCLDTKKQQFSLYYCLMYHLQCKYTPMAMITAAGRGEDGSMILFSRRLKLTLNFFISHCFASREPSRPTSLLPADWSMGLGSGKEDDLLPPGLETLPLRLMLQDCTAVKTLLLRLRRTLQEVSDA